MAKVTNKQIAGVFKKALAVMGNNRKSIASSGGKKQRFICHAIAVGQGLNWRSFDRLSGAGLEAKKVIIKRIYPEYTLENWLNHRGIEHANDLADLQAYRKAWLKQLIEEFSK
jgi:hypothetical protein